MQLAASGRDGRVAIDAGQALKLAVGVDALRGLVQAMPAGTKVVTVDEQFAARLGHSRERVQICDSDAFFDVQVARLPSKPSRPQS